MEEDITDINLCAVHAENRMTEAILLSVATMAHTCNSLPELNAALKPYGPANFKKDRIKVKLRPGQESELTRSNFKIASMTGNYESQPHFIVGNKIN